LAKFLVAIETLVELEALVERVTRRERDRKKERLCGEPGSPATISQTSFSIRVKPTFPTSRRPCPLRLTYPRRQRALLVAVQALVPTQDPVQALISVQAQLPVSRPCPGTWRAGCSTAPNPIPPPHTPGAAGRSAGSALAHSRRGRRPGMCRRGLGCGDGFGGQESLRVQGEIVSVSGEEGRIRFRFGRGGQDSFRFRRGGQDSFRFGKGVQVLFPFRKRRAGFV
jgi:hypothetical protein